jgi:hypothetical protein
MGFEAGAMVEFQTAPSYPLEENEIQRVADYLMTMKTPGWHLAPARAPSPYFVFASEMREAVSIPRKHIGCCSPFAIH